MAATNTATAGQVAAETDLTKLVWHFPEWLGQFGPLNPITVLDYFEHSPFWDPTCNNAVLKMQTQFNALEALQEHLRRMTGVEFSVVHERWPALFIIRKQLRRGPNEVVPLTVYHVVHGHVYQSPDMLTLLNTRISTSLYHLEKAMDRARQLVNFQPSRGYQWRTEETIKMEKEKLDNRETAALSMARRQESQQFQVNIDRLMAALATGTGGFPASNAATFATGTAMGHAGTPGTTSTGRLTLASVQAAMSRASPSQSATLDTTRRKKKGDDTSVTGKKKKKRSQAAQPV